jgi:tetratricopeptide (TPR) repeat protein
VFLLLCAAFAAGVYAIPVMFTRLAHRMPENYRYLVREYMAGGRAGEAEQTLRRRLSQEYYDFDAQYMLAEVQSQAGRSTDAVATMREALRKLQAIRGRNVRASGLDEAEIYRLLGMYLLRAGDPISGGEMLRAALDLGAPVQQVRSSLGSVDSAGNSLAAARLYLKLRDRNGFQAALQSTTSTAAGAALRALWLEQVDSNTTAALQLLDSSQDTGSTPPLLLAESSNIRSRAGMDAQSTSPAGLSPLDLQKFNLVAGADRTSSSLSLYRSITLAGRFDSGVFRTTSLLMRLSGTKALGMYPILVVRSGEAELARLYLDGEQPKAYDLKLWPDGAPKSLPLSLTFENDASDSSTQADRNIQVLELALH